MYCIRSLHYRPLPLPRPRPRPRPRPPLEESLLKTVAPAPLVTSLMALRAFKTGSLFLPLAESLPSVLKILSAPIINEVGAK